MKLRHKMLTTLAATAAMGLVFLTAALAVTAFGGRETPDVVSAATDLRNGPVQATEQAVPTPISMNNWVDVYYYTKEGQYYHVDENCCGMQHASAHTAGETAASGKSACPVCIREIRVYYTDGGTYYHKKADCMGMITAKSHTITEAIAAGKAVCPICMANETVYCTAGGAYYHRLRDCMGMLDAKALILSEASQLKAPCPICVSNETVYFTNGGKYYHRYENCSDMQGAKAHTIEEAREQGKIACPKCMTQ